MNVTPGSFKDYYKGVEQTRKIIKEATTLSTEEKDSIVTYGYGHMGDGDIHINLAFPGYDNHDLLKRLNDLVFPSVMDWVKSTNGSVGAEHGMGVIN